MHFIPRFSLLLALWLVAISAHAENQTKIIHNPKYKKAKDYFYQKKFAVAQVFLKDLAQGYPEDAEVATYLADCQMYLQQWEDALLNYQKANDLLKNRDPDRKIKAANYIRMAKIYYLRKRPEQAMAYFELAALTDVSMVHGFYEKGMTALFLMRDKQQAILAWQEFVVQSPKTPFRDQVEMALSLLKNPDVKIPPEGSPLSVEEALKLAGVTIHAPSPMDGKAK